VVRIAAANLNARHAVLTRSGNDTLGLNVTQAPRSAFKLIAGASHSSDTSGIMSHAGDDLVDSVLRCLRVNDAAGYASLCDDFDRENARRDQDRVELEPVGPFAPRVHIHDPRSLMILRLTDEAGEALSNSRFLLQAGTPPNPDWMPQGFMLDRQANSRTRHVISLFLNHALLAGTDRLVDPRDARKTLRAAVQAHRPYSANVQPDDLAGLVHHAMAGTRPGDDLLDVLGPHQTTVLDVVMPRRVHEGVFRLTQTLMPHGFDEPVPGEVIP
jgi:hypothetical protein